MAEVMTRMAVKVDLQCERCRKKIKKILCKFPQIRDHIYDEKQNAVFITVFCCSPEKIRDKIICKGGDTVLGVEILPPEKPKEKPEPVKQTEAAKKPEKQKEPEKPPPEKPPPAKPAPTPEKQKEPEKTPPAKPAPTPTPAPATVPTPPPKAPEQAPKPAPAPAPAPPPPKPPQPVQGYPPMYPMVGVCWCPCYEGCGGGPCYCQGQGRPMMCYDGCGRPAYECEGRSRPYCGSRCEYFSEENATGCIVM